MNRIKIFLVHGRDESSITQIKDWFFRNSPSIDLITLADQSILGETIPQELERVAGTGDAAIILITPDDFGALEKHEARPRARQNVWLEYGWFWGRLGRRRSMLLFKGSVEVPSDTSGILYANFENSISEAETKLMEFVENIKNAKGDDVTEVIRTDYQPSSRIGDYQSIVNYATHSLLVIGIGMVNIKHDLNFIIGNVMNSNNNLRICFSILDEQYVEANNDVASLLYRRNLSADIKNFEDELRSVLRKYPDRLERVRLKKFCGFITFVASVADCGNIGSMMSVETILPQSNFHQLARPRLILRKRTSGGVYDRYMSAINDIFERSIYVNLN